MNLNIPGIAALTEQIKRLADLYERDLESRKPVPAAESESFSVSYTDNTHEWMMENNPEYRKKMEQGAEYVDELLPEPDDDEVPEGFRDDTMPDVR
jgi:hypothetical protein